MHKVAYTNHIGQSQADKGSRGTNIASAADLAAAEKHNNHKYTPEDLEHIQSGINLELKKYNKQFDRNLQEVGWNDLVRTVKEIYHEEFDGAVEEYNKKQRRKDRRIEDYYEKISVDGKTDLAVEGIIQIGEKETWKDMSLEDRQKTLPIYMDCLKEMDKEFPGLRIAGASFHVNEDSPHLHWIGVCVDDRPKKRGLQVVSNKSAVFTQDNLGSVLQEKLRIRMEEKMQEVFPDWKFMPKKSGRNEDLTKNEMRNLELQQSIEDLEKERYRIKSKIQKSKEELETIEERIDSWDEAVEQMNNEQEYIANGKLAYGIIKNLTDAVNGLTERSGLLRDKKCEERLKRAFMAYSESLNDIVDRLRKYELIYEVSEPISEPIVAAKKTIEEQMQGAKRRKLTEEELAERIAENYLRFAEERALTDSKTLYEALFKIAATLITHGEIDFLTEEEREQWTNRAVELAAKIIEKRQQKFQNQEFHR